MDSENELFFRKLQQEVTCQFSLQEKKFISYNQLHLILSKHLQFLIDNDFHQLVFLLYRIDVSEQKLKDLLAQNPEKDAALLMANLILERLSQKIKTRAQFSSQKNDFTDEETW